MCSPSHLIPPMPEDARLAHMHEASGQQDGSDVGWDIAEDGAADDTAERHGGWLRAACGRATPVFPAGLDLLDADATRLLREVAVVDRPGAIAVEDREGVEPPAG